MNKQDQQRIVDEIFESAMHDIVGKLPRFPDDWNGIQIRRYIAEHIHINYTAPMSPAMRKQFEKDCLSNGI